MGNFPDRGLNVAISRIPQTNYLTAPTPAANSFVREEIKQRNVPNVQQSEVDNAGYATGHGFATESWIESLQNGWPWSFDVSAENIGRYLLAAMGKVTSVQPDDELNPLVWQHNFEPLPFLTSSQLPAYALLAQLLPAANGINRMTPSMIAQSLSLNSSGTAKLDGSVNWVGSGEEITPSAVTWATHVDEIQGTQNYFFSRQAELITSDTDDGNPVNEQCELRAHSFSVENALADTDFGCPRFYDDDPELGAIRSHHLLSQQAYMQNFTLKMRADNPHHEAMINRTPFKIVMKWTGGAIDGDYDFLLQIVSYLVKYTTETTFEDGFAVVKVTPKSLFNVTANKITEVVLINKVASYTT